MKRHSASYLDRALKFEIELPKTIEETVDNETKNRYTYWQDAIAKEMENMQIAFYICMMVKRLPIVSNLSTIIW